MLEVVEAAAEFHRTEDPPNILSQVVIESQATLDEEKNTEADFLESFIQLTREFGYAYDPVDLINFHTAMKSSSLVILVPGHNLITIMVEDTPYYCLIEIIPTQMTTFQWQAMVEGIEQTLQGLSMDLIRKNLGVGQHFSKAIPTVLL